MKVAFVVVVIIFAVANSFSQKRPITIYIAGDSIAANKLPEKRPESGWGEMLQKHFD